MKLNQIKISPEDQVNFNQLVSMYTTVFTLGHDEHYGELGEALEYFEKKYGKKFIRQIEKTDEIKNIIGLG